MVAAPERLDSNDPVALTNVPLPQLTFGALFPALQEAEIGAGLTPVQPEAAATLQPRKAWLFAAGGCPRPLASTVTRNSNAAAKLPTATKRRDPIRRIGADCIGKHLCVNGTRAE